MLGSRIQSWHGLVENTKVVNYEKLYELYVYIFVCMHAESC